MIQLLYCFLLLNYFFLLFFLFFIVIGHRNEGLRVLIQEDARGVRNDMEERGELLVFEEPGAEAVCRVTCGEAETDGEAYWVEVEELGLKG